MHTLYRYFQALAKGEVPPVKDRLEKPLPPADERLGGLTKGALAVLHKQVGRHEDHFTVRSNTSGFVLILVSNSLVNSLNSNDSMCSV